MYDYQSLPSEQFQTRTFFRLNGMRYHLTNPKNTQKLLKVQNFLKYGYDKAKIG
jgi:hypothetical protein